MGFYSILLYSKNKEFESEIFILVSFFNFFYLNKKYNNKYNSLIIKLRRLNFFMPIPEVENVPSVLEYLLLKGLPLPQ